MADRVRPQVAIVDYGLGNLYSVEQACLHAGLDPSITSDPFSVLQANAVILPGVGAFGDAMASLRRLGLSDALCEVAKRGTPLLGICLGMQLLMSESYEYGRHVGLDIVPGAARPLAQFRERHPTYPIGHAKHRLKVPNVGWARVLASDPTEHGSFVQSPSRWAGTLLDGIVDGTHFYFVHSYYVDLADPGLALAWSQFAKMGFCAAFQVGNVAGVQFHPERSGAAGLQLYRSFAGLAGEATLTGVFQT